MKKLIIFSLAAAALCMGCGVANTISTTLNEPSFKTPHSNLAVKPQECVRQGDDVALTFLIQNNGAELATYSFGSRSVTDNLGNKYDASISLGGGRFTQFAASTRLSTGVPLKVTLLITRVASDATRFSIVHFTGKAPGAPVSYKPEGDFAFRNIPIQ